MTWAGKTLVTASSMICAASRWRAVRRPFLAMRSLTSSAGNVGLTPGRRTDEPLFERVHCWNRRARRGEIRTAAAEDSLGCGVVPYHASVTSAEAAIQEYMSCVQSSIRTGTASVDAFVEIDPSFPDAPEYTLLAILASDTPEPISSLPIGAGADGSCGIGHRLLWPVQRWGEAGGA
jgi:hypothetical protein